MLKELNGTGFRILPVHIPTTKSNPLACITVKDHTIFFKKNETRQSVGDLPANDRTIFMMNLPITPFTKRSLYQCLSDIFSTCGTIQSIHLKTPGKYSLSLSYAPTSASDGNHSDESDKDKNDTVTHLMRPGSFLYVVFTEEEAVQQSYLLKSTTFEWSASANQSALSRTCLLLLTNHSYAA
jgi:hypothetical protein